MQLVNYTFKIVLYKLHLTNFVRNGEEDESY